MAYEGTSYEGMPPSQDYEGQEEYAPARGQTPVDINLVGNTTLDSDSSGNEVNPKYLQLTKKEHRKKKSSRDSKGT
ncbi:hypothetical protein GGTG_11942 [Gaeumannomyces tritici R3-111a-1]|uniref:Uncharacterized protein n=1 Tax=Gaeumannomyces tritici (strain R3-111a-1) TaxID=644352 RepID=J3PEL1_GAET3|nr:hypothetical protein GGTG_11942 [Gaeumannomyces tritici R3-111a-1]EJT70919.1 hypothetical protein GGTG_11942 [Gaeumannomyces tritici R3-111a-1]